MAKNDSGNNRGEALIGAVVSYDFTAPTNWLACDGSAVSQTTYADLYDVIGTTNDPTILVHKDDADNGGTLSRRASWHPDGDYIVAATDNSTHEVKVYSFNGTTLTEVYNLNLGHAANLVEWTPDGNNVVILRALCDHEVSLYSWDGVAETLTFVRDSSVINTGNHYVIRCTSNSSFVAVGSGEGQQLKIVKLSDMSNQSYYVFGNSVTGLDWTSDDSFIAACMYTGSNRLKLFSWNGTALSLKQELDIVASYVKWSTSDDYLFIASGTNILVYSFNGVDTLTYVMTKALGTYGAAGLDIYNEKLIIGGSAGSALSVEFLRCYIWDETNETLTYSEGITTTAKANDRPRISYAHDYIVSCASAQTSVTIHTYSMNSFNPVTNFTLPTTADSIIRSL